MQKFDGFAKGKQQTILLPERFFSDLLPLIDNLNALRLTLHCFWALHQREGEHRFLRHADLAGDAGLLALLGGQEALTTALDQIVAGGVLLAVRLPAPSETIYFMNTEKGRLSVAALEVGHWQPGTTTPIGQIFQQPNLFALYEQNIGPLTPMLADTLRDAEQTYPEAWLSDAIRAAVENNKRSWRYVQAILRRWEQEGRTDVGKSTDKDSAPNPYLRYFEDE
jgi:DNA replication protein